jgi:hypothetical protein
MEWCTIDAECGVEAKEKEKRNYKEYKIKVIFGSHAIINPRTMVIENLNT